MAVCSIEEQRKERDKHIEEEANVLFGLIVNGAKSALWAYVHNKECELAQEKAFKETAESKLESVMSLCRRAHDEGKLDDETFKMLSLIRSNGSSEDYKPQNYKE